MGEVLLFRDRRNGDGPRRPPDGGDPGSMTKLALHEHLRSMHGWGGPKSTTREALDRVHVRGHQSPNGWEKPHSHDGGV